MMARSITSTPMPTLSPLNQAQNAYHRLLTMKNQPQFIWILTGPAGCGKSTLGKYLANTMKVPYIEGDEFHPKDNVEKMAHGIPLIDADRWDWLVSLRETSLDYLAVGHQAVVLSCSALKRKYRDVMRVAQFYSEQVIVHFFYLDAPEDVLLARVRARKGHYMGVNMVHSQLTILELPEKDETDVSRVDINRSLEKTQEELLTEISILTMKQVS
ncbi:putative gluconokinase [Golovinomyces cichoracearum]|uniref:Gluconokinase n=1 Tax=Golovinomyces cichoracearum TaxID=62708 RepID=A0A420IC13_9PEZI|nr:putative gluconokinase [Golovinomyces cichoracearum]